MSIFLILFFGYGLWEWNRNVYQLCELYSEFLTGYTWIFINRLRIWVIRIHIYGTINTRGAYGLSPFPGYPGDLLYWVCYREFQLSPGRESVLQGSRWKCHPVISQPGQPEAGRTALPARYGHRYRHPWLQLPGPGLTGTAANFYPVQWFVNAGTDRDKRLATLVYQAEDNTSQGGGSITTTYPGYVTGGTLSDSETFTVIDFFSEGFECTGWDTGKVEYWNDGMLGNPTIVPLFLCD